MQHNLHLDISAQLLAALMTNDRPRSILERDADIRHAMLTASELLRRYRSSSGNGSQSATLDHTPPRAHPSAPGPDLGNEDVTQLLRERRARQQAEQPNSPRPKPRLH